MHVLTTIAVMASAVVFALYTWDLAVSLAGFLPVELPPEPPSRRRFAVLVCAHNEERVVAGVVHSLQAQTYPAHCVRVFVIADNCTDKTAEVAAGAGAQVLVRTDPARRTKGHALAFGLSNVLEDEWADAICVFDADNAAAPEFLEVMNRYLGAGHQVIQAYLDTKNPLASWVTACIALAYFVTNRFWMRARTRLSLAATLGGTGFCLSREVAATCRWDTGALADDLDFTMTLIHHGVQVSYCPHTRTFDEKPVTLARSLRQRTRWMQGHYDVLWRWGPRLLLDVLTRPLLKPAARAFDALLHLLQPVRVLLSFVLLALLIVLFLTVPEEAALTRAFYFTTPGWGLAALIYLVYPVVIAVSERVPLRVLAHLPLFLLFGLSWLPAVALGLVRARRREWLHTRHGEP